jgi:hypothetical protein
VGKECGNVAEEKVPEDWVPLAGLIRVLRSELSVAHGEGEGADISFAVGPIELDLDIGVTKEGGGDAGIRFWVVSLGAKGSYQKVQTQHIKLTLIPQLPDGTDLKVATTGQIDPSQVRRQPPVRR